MPKEVNLTGDQVVALTRKYLAAEDVAFVQKALVYAVDCHSGQFGRNSGNPRKQILRCLSVSPRALQSTKPT